MSQAALPALGLIGALLLALAAAPARIAVRAAPWLSAIGAALALLDVLAATHSASIPLPVGLPGAHASLALDGLSAFFALLLLIAGTAATSLGGGGPVVGAALLTLLAGDAPTLALGVAAVGLCMIADRKAASHATEAAEAPVIWSAPACAIAAGICLLAALALAGPARFEAIRLHPPDAGRDAAVLILALLGVGALLGCATGAASRASASASALAAGAIPNLAVYIVARVLFDLGGPAQPAGWGMALLVLGSLLAAWRASRACFADDIARALATASGAQVGYTLAGFGLAWIARASDLTTLAALALGGALVSAAAHALGASLLALCGQAVERGAGTRAFARLGGLIHGMPATTAATLVGAASLGALPLTAGFAALWTLAQAIVGAPRAGDLGLGLVVCAATALLALASALLATAMLRGLGVAYLGRPRSPRAAAAIEVVGPLRGAMLLLAGLLAAAGVFPTGLLALAAPAIQVLLPAHLPEPAPMLSMTAAGGAGGYAAPGIALLLALAASAGVLAARRGVRGHVSGPAWADGFDPPPAWLPFGDPLTQVSAASFAAPLQPSIGRLAALVPQRWSAAVVGRVGLGLPALTARGVTLAGGLALAVGVIGVAAALALR